MARALPYLALLALLAPAVHTYKVLFIPVPGGSHMVLVSSLAEAWIKVGHEAHIAKPHSVPIPSQFKDAGIKLINYGKEDEVHFTLRKEFTEQLGKMSQKGFLETAKLLSKVFPTFCSDLLTAEGLPEKLAKENYDFVVVDNLPVLDCFHAVPHRLGLPYGTVSVMGPLDISNSLQLHYLTSTVPMFYSKEPSFLRRLGNLIAIHAMSIGMNFNFDQSILINYLKDNPVANSADLKRNSKIWLVAMEPMLFAPTHAAPNVVYVGGLSSRPARPLPADMGKFADSAKDGLIVVSFGGSLTADFPEEMLKRLMDGLSAVKYKSVIRLETKPKFKIGSNIMITKWLPQSDLLGHNNTVLFISHCGLSSVNEAVHYGVPILGFPYQEEQQSNALRAAHKNYGTTMDRNTFTSAELKQAIERMVTEPTYRKAVKKASNIIKSRRFNAQEEAVYWIDHVIKYGGDHLVPFTSQLSWFQILMYDILFFFIALLVIVIFIIVQCCKCVGRLCCQKRQPQKQKTK